MNRLILLAAPLLLAACQGESTPGAADPAASAQAATQAPAASEAASQTTPAASSAAGNTNTEWVKGTVIQTASVLRRFNWHLASANTQAGAQIDALFARPAQPVTLDFTGGVMAVKNTCNQMQGSIQLTADTLTLGALDATEKACADAALQALDAAVATHLKGKMTVRFAPGIEPKLSLANEAGDTLIFNSTPVTKEADGKK